MTLHHKYAVEAVPRNSGDDVQQVADFSGSDFSDAVTADTRLVPFGMTAAFDLGATFGLSAGFDINEDAGSGIPFGGAALAWGTAGTVSYASLDGSAGAVSSNPTSPAAGGQMELATIGVGSDASVQPDSVSGASPYPTATAGGDGSSSDAAQASLSNSSATSLPGPSRLVMPADDFNGDGKADLLFQNNSGQIWQWLMSANQISASGSLGNPGSNWHVVGSGKFTGTGTDQSILMQSDSGDVWQWQMGASGNQIVSSTEIGNPGPAWHVAASADFTGQGKDDILMQNDDGEIWEWGMENNQIVQGAPFSGEVGNPGPSWHVVATGDFTGTGNADIVLQNDNGDIWEWEMAGTGILASHEVGNPGQSWHVAGTAYLSGVAPSDILFQNDSGQVWEWQMSGFSITASNSIGNPGQSWHVAATGDFNGDGKTDILFQNDSGQVWQWLMNGNHIAASNSVGNPGSSWPVV